MTYADVGRMRQSPMTTAARTTRANTAASQLSKKQQWRDGIGGGGGALHSDPMAPLKTRASVDCMEIEHAQLLLLQREEQFYQQSPTDATAMIMDDYDMVTMEDENGDADETMLLSPTVAPSTVHTLPQEMLQHMLKFLDGHSLLACSLVCRAMTPLTYDRDVWKNICMQQWPTLQTQFLPQLPGAPDYDLIRLYGGCWRRCFVEQHQFNARAELRMQIPQFPALAATTDVDKIVSETFSIGEHRFSLWIFPNGNPNEPQYAGKVLSVYLVLTDLERRAPSWLTCAVFSLSVVNHVDPSKRIEWHSCLVDNKFDHQLNNWGVHSLGALKNLTNPENGFLQQDNTLTVTAKVRLMSITFRVVREHDMKCHHHLGLTDLARVDTVELPFCCTLQDLLKVLQTKYNLESDQVNVWCFNQPVVSGQALRPRKLLTHASVDPRQPMFGNLLCDGVDIDAYSFCHIYVESKVDDDAPLECATMATSYRTEDGISSAMDVEADSAVLCANGHDGGYLFVKIMDPRTQQLEYLGRINFAAHLTTSMIYDCVAKHVGCASSDLIMFKEEIAPTVVSGPIASSDKPVMTAQSQFDHTCNGGLLHPTDIVIFTLRGHCTQNAFVTTMENLLWTQYAHAESLVQDSFAVPTLQQIETLAEKLDIPKFRVRSAFRKCNEDGRRTLKYIMEGRHLGFICDSCGETDFKGPRFNCSLCADYDLCRACNAQCQEVSHRYANRDGKWQRVYNFKEHKVAHQMREMMPVFYQYRPDKNARLHGHEDAAFMVIQQ